MKKRTLVSLLAIPIFSVATTFNSFSQESEKVKSKEVGAAVIDFLLRNPKTANKMNSNERTALNIISDLLKTSGQREHEIEYAIAGRSQTTINTTDSRQAQFVKDGSGNIYLIVDGVIHPIAQELINQASSILSIDNATLLPYNLNGLESMFNEDLRQHYRVQKGGEYLSDIAKKFDVPASNIFYWKSEDKLRPISKQKKIWENKKRILRSLPFSSHLTLLIIKEKISAVFSYKWHRDLNNDGALGFNEFNQIKRTFYNDEDFNIGIHYQTKKGFKGNLELKIFEDYTGELMLDKKWERIIDGAKIHLFPIHAELLPVGLYLIHTNLINDDSNTVSSKSERFEIIQKSSKTTEKNINCLIKSIKSF